MTKLHSPEMKPLDNQQAVVGYSTMFRVYKEALKKAGFEIITDKGDVQLNFMPPLYWHGLIKTFPAKKRFVCSMWEADGVDPAWIEIANENFDALIVPNNYNKDLFEKNGLKIPCLAVGLGIQKEYMNYIPRRYKKGDDFYFLHYNAGEVRKGWYLLLDAFNEEFQNEPNVKIILKNSGVHERVMNKGLSNYPTVNKKAIVHRGRYPLDKMIEITSQAHCFVFPALGEGYSLTPREMMATGMPVIVSSGSSFDEMPDYYIKTKTTLKPGVSSYKPKIQKAFSGLAWVHDNYKDFNTWYTDIDALRANMRDVYENYEKHAELAKKGAEKAKEDEDVDILIKPLVKFLTDNL